VIAVLLIPALLAAGVIVGFALGMSYADERTRRRRDREAATRARRRTELRLLARHEP
jgi:uncharacterized membrane protein SpoIIM required for sporulation